MEHPGIKWDTLNGLVELNSCHNLDCFVYLVQRCTYLLITAISDRAGCNNVKALSMTFIIGLTTWSDVITWMRPMQSITVDALSLHEPMQSKHTVDTNALYGKWPIWTMQCFVGPHTTFRFWSVDGSLQNVQGHRVNKVIPDHARTLILTLNLT